MKPGLHPGHTATLQWSVRAEHCIHLAADRPRSVAVFATPSMINLMEHAAREAIRPFLDEGEESVGASVQIEHVAATPIGAVATAEARVTQVQGRLVDFEVVARDRLEIIGRGTHRRAVVAVDRIAAKVQEKSSQLRESAMIPIDVAPNPGPLPKLSTMIVETSGAVVWVTLNRPEKLNAVNAQMTSDWERVNAWLAGHPELRVVVVTGAGTAFCAGDDVPEVGTLSMADAQQLSYRQARMYLAWERLPQVFIAALNGLALGAGCVAAYSCDFRIATHAAVLGMPEVKLGWPPGYGVSQLTAIVGKARALELCLLGESIPANTALDIGLVHQVVPSGRLRPAVEAIAARLTALSADAVRETKRLVHADESLASKQNYLADTAAYIRCLETPNAREGIEAFKAKRTPKFRE